MVGAPKVLAKSFKSVFDEVQFIVNSFLLLPTPPDKLFLPPDKSFVPSQTEQVPKLPPALLQTHQQQT